MSLKRMLARNQRSRRNRVPALGSRSQVRRDAFRDQTRATLANVASLVETCPICAHMAREGLPSYELAPDGSYLEVPAPPVGEQIALFVTPDEQLTSCLGRGPIRELVPRDCLASDLLAYLHWLSLQRGLPLPQCSLALLDGDRELTLDEPLHDGQELTLRSWSH